LIASCTSVGVRPRARIVPAYGTVMLPLVSTTWFGSVTKLPGRAFGSLGMKSPPGSASKIVMLTTSPMPSVICGGGRENTLAALDLHWVLEAASAGA
jgi:hypothetical protein